MFVPTLHMKIVESLTLLYSSLALTSSHFNNIERRRRKEMKYEGEVCDAPVLRDHSIVVVEVAEVVDV